MKSNGTTTYLNWALAVVVLATAVFAARYYFASREVRQNQGLIEKAARLQNAQNDSVKLNNLLADTLEYSKTHPAIDPLLEKLGVKPTKSSGTASPAKPAAK